MIGPLLWLIYLLIRIPNARCLVADDGLMSMIWCKHWFQRGRSNLYGKFVHFTGYRANNLLRNKLETVGTEQNFEKVARNWHDGKTKRQH